MSSSSPTNIASFNIDAVFRQLHINPQFEPLEAAACRFVYDSHLIDSDLMPGMKRRAAELHNTVQFLQGRLDCLEHYSENFFANYPHDRQALVLAALCGDYIHTANEEERASLNIAFDPDLHDPEKNLLRRARVISGEAQQLLAVSCEYEIAEYSREGLFLAHLLALKHYLPAVDYALATSAGDTAEDGVYDVLEELSKFVEYDYRSMVMLADTKTDLGEKLRKMARMNFDLAAKVVPVSPKGDIARNDNFILEV